MTILPSSPPFKAPGPFGRIVAIQFGQMARFKFQLTRDDGVTFSPDLDETITLTLYTPLGLFLFSGQSRRSNPNQPLDYFEGAEGLVVRFHFELGYYLLELDRLLLQSRFDMGRENLRCYLRTSGSKTLETGYHRVYHSGATSALIGPGTWDLTFPYWHQVTQFNHPTPTRTEQQTTLSSSVPFQATLEMVGGQALLAFLFPVLGIIWHPKADLSGWHGTFDIRDICSGGTVTAPWQYPAGVTQPTEPPESLLDRRYTLFENITLTLSVSACPGRWSEPAVSIQSNVGFQTQLPTISADESLIDLEQPLSEFGGSLAGETFSLTGELLWDRDHFTYSTGEPLPLSGQTATLVESPVLDFASFIFNPLPEK
ncbi:MAG: hypothetical protein HQL72_00450 [Magnetococcales bacterium]|nr:hypothetical protein [Magnetococcales bacterium]